MLESIQELALRRAGFQTLSEFLEAKRVTDAQAEMALMPYVVGYEVWRVEPGDTFSRLAQQFGTTVRAIEVANPGQKAENLPVGTLLVIPLRFSVVPEDTPMSSELLHYIIRGLQARYPILRDSVIGRTYYGRPLELLRVGDGDRVVYYNASHHANEWITTPLVLMCLESYLRAAAFGETLMGLDIPRLMEETTLLLVPMVNPDGVDLLTGGASEQEYEAARRIGENYPDIPFPEGWKANLQGVDLNLNYPARWEEAREIKYEQGYETLAPRDFVGLAPLSEPESRAMFDTTEEIDPDLVIAWHTQGKEIYWKFLDLEPEGARALGEQMAAASGYSLEEIPYASSFAGYKDWFIQDFDRPGYTIEAGAGQNPLPISQLPEMYEDNLPIFLLGLTGTLTQPENGEGLTVVEEAVPAMRETMAPHRIQPQRQLPQGNGMAWG